jgi:hypothetical protein
MLPSTLLRAAAAAAQHHGLPLLCAAGRIFFYGGPGTNPTCHCCERSQTSFTASIMRKTSPWDPTFLSLSTTVLTLRVSTQALCPFFFSRSGRAIQNRHWEFDSTYEYNVPSVTSSNTHTLPSVTQISRRSLSRVCGRSRIRAPSSAAPPEPTDTTVQGFKHNKPHLSSAYTTMNRITMLT